jgi:cytochrome c oxidase subunit II
MGRRQRRGIDEMTYQVAHMQAVLGQNMLQRIQDWWWQWNFRGYGYSTFAEHTDWLFFWIYAITAFFFILLMVLMFYFTFKYRRRPGSVPTRSRSHNTALELTWSIVPTIILVWMFFEGFRGYANKMMVPGNAPEVLVTGQKWSWSVTYPNGAASADSTRSRKMGNERGRGEGLTEIPIFVMPERTPIKLRMHSIDVIHAFWIPDFRAKFDVYPNRYTGMWFESTGINAELAERMGWILTGEEEDAEGNMRTVPLSDGQGNPVYYQDHWVFCAEYCGQNHSEMAAIIRVVPREHYVRIIETWARPTGTPWEIGRALYRIKGCNACHTIDGTQGTGPTFLGMYGARRNFTDGTSAVADEDYIRESILDPGAKIVQEFPNVMQSYDGRVTNEELEALIVFLRSPQEQPPDLLPEEEPRNGQEPQAN